MPRIHIEDKHTYNSVNLPIFGARFDNNAINVNNDFNNNRPLIQYITPTYPVTGTDDFNRIGRKISSQSLVLEGFLKLYNAIDNNNVNTIYDVYTYHNSDTVAALVGQVTPQSAPFNTNEQALDVSIRHYVVEFNEDSLDQAELREYIYRWFTGLHIQTGTYNLSSNRMQVMRESTAYTGDFKILYDKVHHLSLSNPIIHYKETIPYKRVMNFDGTGAGSPTSKMVCEIFVGPTNIYVDYGNFSLGQWINNNTDALTPNIYVAELSATMKLKYTDF